MCAERARVVRTPFASTEASAHDHSGGDGVLLLLVLLLVVSLDAVVLVVTTMGRMSNRNVPSLASAAQQ